MVWNDLHRGATIIVDGNGRIAAATEIDAVSASDLQAVADGRSVNFKPAEQIETSSGESAGNIAEHPLFVVSVSKAAPNAKISRDQSSAHRH